jgi:ABC-type sugar transport system substrate-binding protein
MPKLPVSAGAIRKLLREITASGSGEQVLAVGGAPELAPLLRQQLRRGGAEPAAVRLGRPEGARVYVHVVSDEPDDGDIAVLRRARRAAVPVVAVAAGVPDDSSIPYVPATDVVWVGAGDAFPLETIARAIAARLGERGAPLAVQVPLLREAVSGHLVASLARKNGLVAAATWIRGPDLPSLALNEFRLVLRLAQAQGAADDPLDRLPELAATLGAGFGLRALARLLNSVPRAGWALEAAIAYGGTRAIGEAARTRFALAPTRLPGGVGHASP